jgi:hypothetical protein
MAEPMSLLLPKPLSEIGAQLPESSHGACRATLVLNSGRRIPNVTLAWGAEVVKIGERSVSETSDLDFSLGEVIDVLPQ